ncbi:MAG: CapA family protein [Guyparkeria sp.]|uniref:CapA family protein n=1 Tax=Guyparkeria sp. TaxID=2035736 RepID=UPI0039795D91
MSAAQATPADTTRITLMLTGDVMTGRGVDQIQPVPSDPTLHEEYLRDARGYLRLAEAASGPIPRRVAPTYIWGDALPALAAAAPDRRLINLETAVTTADSPWPDKGINYRMHPANIDCIRAVAPDCCVLANNHVLDWGRDGLLETLDTLDRAGIATAGAGHDADEAMSPAVLRRPDGGRLLVFAAGHRSSGVPDDWAAGPGRCGVHCLPDFSAGTIDRLAERIEAARRPGDQVLLSIHWGGNWGYEIPDEHRAFAHRLIDRGVVDLVHGHSSHHPRAIEVHRDRLILYGCGDLLNDYEGIRGHERYRGDLALIYLPTLEEGRLTALRMLPFRIGRFRLNHPSADDIDWLAATMDREAARFGGGVERKPDDTLALHWPVGS